MDVSIELVKKIEGAEDLSGAVEVMQPVLQLRAIVRIAGKAVHDQLHLLFRQILKRVFASSWLDQAFDGVVVIKLHVHFACDTEPSSQANPTTRKRTLRRHPTRPLPSAPVC